MFHSNSGELFQNSLSDPTPEKTIRDPSVKSKNSTFIVRILCGIETFVKVLLVSPLSVLVTIQSYVNILTSVSISSPCVTTTPSTSCFLLSVILKRVSIVFWNKYMSLFVRVCDVEALCPGIYK